MATNAVPPISRTDVQFQEVKLFLEGIQVPFINISVNSALGQLPQAAISIPPQVGLMEITRFYNPKVHIFYLDPIDGKEKQLFSGVLVSSSIQRAHDGTAITFNAVHRYQLLSELLMDFSSWTTYLTNPNVGSDQAVKVNLLNSKASIGLALTGIFINDPKMVGPTKLEVSVENIPKGVASMSPQILPSYLKGFENRLIGMPSILLNLWNQLRQGTYVAPSESDIMIKLYEPLVQDGLQLFQRMTGHYYLDFLIESDRADPCADIPSPEARNKPRLVPPCFNLYLKSALRADIGAEQIASHLQHTGELMDIMSLFAKFLSSVDYDIVVLSSPAEIMKNPALDTSGYFKGDKTDTYAADFVVKPQLPFYFSPRCNVLFPSMIRSMNINQDDYGIPTRIVARNSIRAGGEGVDLFIRAPASIREAVSKWSPTPNLKATLSGSHGKVGKFEQGRGVKAEKFNMPQWLSYLSHTQSKDISGNTQLPDPKLNPKEYAAIQSLEKGWIKRYGAENLAMNPWSASSQLSAHQRLLIGTTDYYYSTYIARSRNGTAETIFNPYMVVGYPMDLLDSTPNHPSFHAYCTSVTHNISANGISTTVGFVSAMTYTELANYYLPATHPWLQVTLGLAESQSIVDYAMVAPTTDPNTDSTTLPFGGEDPIDPSARGIADRFYVTTLATGAVAPADVYNFESGQVKPVTRQNWGLKPGQPGSKIGANGGEQNPNLSGIGNLDLVYRDIESRENVEKRWGIKFVDLTPGNYNTNVIKISNSKVADFDKLEPGQSIFLDYDDKI